MKSLSLIETLLSNGSIIAVKGLGGFHLAVDAGNTDAVAALRKKKHREEKPMAVMSFDVAIIVISPFTRSST